MIHRRNWGRKVLVLTGVVVAFQVAGIARDRKVKRKQKEVVRVAGKPIERAVKDLRLSILRNTIPQMLPYIPIGAADLPLSQLSGFITVTRPLVEWLRWSYEVFASYKFRELCGTPAARATAALGLKIATVTMQVADAIGKEISAKMQKKIEEGAKVALEKFEANKENDSQGENKKNNVSFLQNTLKSLGISSEGEWQNFMMAQEFIGKVMLIPQAYPALEELDRKNIKMSIESLLRATLPRVGLVVPDEDMEDAKLPDTVEIQSNDQILGILSMMMGGKSEILQEAQKREIKLTKLLGRAYSQEVPVVFSGRELAPVMAVAIAGLARKGAWQNTKKPGRMLSRLVELLTYAEAIPSKLVTKSLVQGNELKSRDARKLLDEIKKIESIPFYRYNPETGRYTTEKTSGKKVVDFYQAYGELLMSADNAEEIAEACGNVLDTVPSIQIAGTERRAAIRELPKKFLQAKPFEEIAKTVDEAFYGAALPKALKVSGEAFMGKAATSSGILKQLDEIEGWAESLGKFMADSGNGDSAGQEFRQMLINFYDGKNDARTPPYTMILLAYDYTLSVALPAIVRSMIGMEVQSEIKGWKKVLGKFREVGRKIAALQGFALSAAHAFPQIGSVSEQEIAEKPRVPFELESSEKKIEPETIVSAVQGRLMPIPAIQGVYCDLEINPELFSIALGIRRKGRTESGQIALKHYFPSITITLRNIMRTVSTIASDSIITNALVMQDVKEMVLTPLSAMMDRMLLEHGDQQSGIIVMSGASMLVESSEGLFAGITKFIERIEKRLDEELLVKEQINLREATILGGKSVSEEEQKKVREAVKRSVATSRQFLNKLQKEKKELMDRIEMLESILEKTLSIDNDKESGAEGPVKAYRRPAAASLVSLFDKILGREFVNSKLGIDDRAVLEILSDTELSDETKAKITYSVANNIVAWIEGIRETGFVEGFIKNNATLGLLQLPMELLKKFSDAVARLKGKDEELWRAYGRMLHSTLSEPFFASVSPWITRFSLLRQNIALSLYEPLAALGVLFSELSVSGNARKTEFENVKALANKITDGNIVGVPAVVGAAIGLSSGSCSLANSMYESIEWKE